MHNRGEIQNGLEVIEIAHLGRFTHQEMMANEPGRCFGLFRREAKPGPSARNAFASNGVVFRPALCDVVQKGCHIERAAALERWKKYRRKGMVLRQSPLLKGRQYANSADEMLVHRVVVIHVELHHRHDLAEFRNEAAQYARLIHHAQQSFPMSRC